MHIISEKAMTPHSSTLAWKIHIYKSFSTMLEKEHQKKKRKEDKVEKLENVN